MGTGSVALDVVYQQLARSKLEAGTQVGVPRRETLKQGAGASTVVCPLIIVEA
jgi:hypothetical protein